MWLRRSSLIRRLRRRRLCQRRLRRVQKPLPKQLLAASEAGAGNKRFTQSERGLSLAPAERSRDAFACTFAADGRPWQRRLWWWRRRLRTGGHGRCIGSRGCERGRGSSRCGGSSRHAANHSTKLRNCGSSLGTKRKQMLAAKQLYEVRTLAMRVIHTGHGSSLKH
eukprot:2962062-Pleurochrysis_carterae.AAC.1